MLALLFIQSISLDPGFHLVHVEHHKSVNITIPPGYAAYFMTTIHLNTYFKLTFENNLGNQKNICPFDFDIIQNFRGNAKSVKIKVHTKTCLQM
jgi:hypothetical protein